MEREMKILTCRLGDYLGPLSDWRDRFDLVGVHHYKCEDGDMISNAFSHFSKEIQESTHAVTDLNDFTSIGGAWRYSHVHISGTALIPKGAAIKEPRGGKVLTASLRDYLGPFRHPDEFTIKGITKELSSEYPDEAYSAFHQYLDQIADDVIAVTDFRVFSSIGGKHRTPHLLYAGTAISELKK